MWISRQMKKSTPTADADLGMTTISGERSGVLTRGEVRALPIYGPGGYLWMPENGDSITRIDPDGYDGMTLAEWEAANGLE